MKPLPLLILMLLWLSPGVVQAQTITGYVGVVSPRGDFGDNDDEEDGYATTGLGLTGEYSRPVSTEGLEWVTTASLLLNGTDDIFGSAIDSGYWINIPILSGIKYQMPVSPTMEAFGLAQLGFNLVKGPSGEYEDFDIEISGGTATSLGFGIGGGVVINQQVNVSLRYLRLGEPEITFELESDFGNSEVESEGQIRVVQFMVGYRFR